MEPESVKNRNKIKRIKWDGRSKVAVIIAEMPVNVLSRLYRNDYLAELRNLST